MKTFIKKFQKKDKNNQVRKEESSLMMFILGLYQINYLLIAITLSFGDKARVSRTLQCSKDELEAKRSLNQEIEVIKALKLLWEETAANISKYHLRMMGCDINDEGSRTAIRLTKSGCNEVESAYYITLV